MDNRVKEIRIGLGATQKEWAELLDVTPMAISNIETGKMELTKKIAQRIEKHYGLPRNSLRKSDHLPVPIIGSAAAGTPAFSQENFSGFVSMYNFADYSFGEIIAVDVVGDSMEERIRDGDVAYIHLQDDLENYTVGAFSYQNGIVIKQLRKCSDHFELHSINEKYYPVIINDADTDFRILGKVVGTFSRL